MNFYGDSKWQADQKIQALADERFKVVVLRPPMIYGKGSKGNYPQLAKLAGKLPLFPIVHNQRSMLYIENLAQFVKRMIDNEETGVFFPQNEQYINTSDLVQMIAVVKADAYGHGAVPIARLVQDYDYIWGFAVATEEEALSLREAGIRKPILVLGLVFPECMEELAKNDR